MYSAELLEEARRMMFHMLSKVVEYGVQTYLYLQTFRQVLSIRAL